MPYIEPEARLALDTEVTRSIETVGELNYLITMGILKVPLCDLEEYIQLTIASYIIGKAPSYTLYNGVIGACMCALLEFARRTGDTPCQLEDIMAAIISGFYYKAIGPYEDEKIEENGDIDAYVNYPKLSVMLPEEEIAYAQGLPERPDNRA